MATGSFQQCPVIGPEEKAQSEAQEAPSEWQETLFYCQDHQALTQVAQRGCEVYLFRDFQKLSRHGPRQLALGGPAWVGWTEPDDLQIAIFSVPPLILPSGAVHRSRNFRKGHINVEQF